MPPRGVKSSKRTRQYEHIKDSAKARGKSPRRAKEIAARTVNKQRSKVGETKTAPRRGTAGKTARGKTARGKSSSSSSRGGSRSSSNRSSSGRSRSKV